MTLTELYHYVFSIQADDGNYWKHAICDITLRRLNGKTHFVDVPSPQTTSAEKKGTEDELALVSNFQKEFSNTTPTIPRTQIVQMAKEYRENNKSAVISLLEAELLSMCPINWRDNPDGLIQKITNMGNQKFSHAVEERYLLLLYFLGELKDNRSHKAKQHKFLLSRVEAEQPDELVAVEYGINMDNELVEKLRNDVAEDVSILKNCKQSRITTYMLDYTGTEIHCRKGDIFEMQAVIFVPGNNDIVIDYNIRVDMA